MTSGSGIVSETTLVPAGIVVAIVILGVSATWRIARHAHRIDERLSGLERDMAALRGMLGDRRATSRPLPATSTS